MVAPRQKNMSIIIIIIFIIITLRRHFGSRPIISTRSMGENALISLASPACGLRPVPSAFCPWLPASVE